MKELVDYNNNFEDQTNNSKNIFQIGFNDDNLNSEYFYYLRKTNLFNLNSYTSIKYTGISLDSEKDMLSIGQLIKLPNISIVNNSIRNNLEVSLGVILDNNNIVFKTSIYNYLKIFNSLDFVLKNNLNVYSKKIKIDNDNDNDNDNNKTNIYYGISSGININLFKKIDILLLQSLNRINIDNINLNLSLKF